ncbi:MAG: hypothetical protein M3063_02580 [Actinomycetota bacterium]|nr:hypothetical protein [Actinomycetota bacterium]
MSQWRQGVCAASTPVAVSEVPMLINLLVRALGEATTPVPQVERTPTPRTIRQDVATLVRSRLRPRLAPIIAHAPARRRRPEPGN